MLSQKPYLNVCGSYFDTVKKPSLSSLLKVTWTVSDPAYASVDKNGVLVAIKPTFNVFPGRNYITLTATCGSCKYETAVFIKEEW